MRIFHIATVADWEAAQVSGSYTTSTRGRTLAEEGFVHASRGDQWQDVRRRWYAGVTQPLVLLVIDPQLLTSPVVDEAVPGSDETFPHIYGPLDPAAVVRTIPLAADPDSDSSGAPAAGAVLPGPHADGSPDEPGPSFSRVYLQEVFRHLAVATSVLAVVVVGTLVGLAVHDEWGPLVGATVGLSVGLVAARRHLRRAPA